MRVRESLLRGAAVLAIAGLTLPAAASPEALPGAGNVVSLRVGEREVTLSDDDKRLLSDRVRDVLSGCGLNSEDDPDHFRGESAASVWETTLSRSRLYVRFAEPFENTPWFGDKHLVSEGLIGLHARLPGPDLTRHRGETLLHIKCDGTRLLALMCAPPLRPHLTETQVKNCRFLDRQPM